MTRRTSRRPKRNSRAKKPASRRLVQAGRVWVDALTRFARSSRRLARLVREDGAIGEDLFDAMATEPTFEAVVVDVLEHLDARRRGVDLWFLGGRGRTRSIRPEGPGAFRFVFTLDSSDSASLDAESPSSENNHSLELLEALRGSGVNAPMVKLDLRRSRQYGDDSQDVLYEMSGVVWLSEAQLEALVRAASESS